jgi:hypothetical protein
MPAYHGPSHQANGPDPGPAPLHIKVFPDPNSPAAVLVPELADVTVGEELFVFWIDWDLGGTYLREAEAGVSVAGGVTVMIRNLTAGVDMLTDPITIDGGEFSSFTSGSPSLIDNDNAFCELGDRLCIDVLTVSGDPQGLGVMLHFGPRLPDPT